VRFSGDCGNDQYEIDEIDCFSNEKPIGKCQYPIGYAAYEDTVTVEVTKFENTWYQPTIKINEYETASQSITETWITNPLPTLTSYLINGVNMELQYAADGSVVAIYKFVGGRRTPVEFKFEKYSANGFQNRLFYLIEGQWYIFINKGFQLTSAPPMASNVYNSALQVPTGDWMPATSVSSGPRSWSPASATATSNIAITPPPRPH